ETLLGVQFYSPDNPRPYDDTGWSIPLLRNVKATAVADKSILTQPMTLASADIAVPGSITGSGPVVLVDNTTDNTLVTFRFTHAGVKMAAAEQPFEAAGHKFPAGSFVIAKADRAALEPSIKELGLTAYAVASAPTVPTHDLDVPRIGYIHTWTSTQDEGWVRMAFDKFKVPYTYFGDNLARQGNLRSKYDVIVFPHAGGSGSNLVYGGVQGAEARPYKKSDDMPHLGIQDSTDDMRGGLGYDGLQELYKFVNEGGVLITEGGTATIFPEFNMTPGVTIEQGEGLYVRGSVLKAVIADKTSPVVYGYDQNALAVYFNQAPVLAVGGGGFGRGGGGRGGAGVDGGPGNFNMQPQSVPPKLTTLEGGAPSMAGTPPAAESAGRGGRGGGRGAGGGGGFGGRGGGGGAATAPRALITFPTDPNDMLLSGVLVGGQALAGRAVVVDAPVGKGHVVMFANRPYWRWQTQGNFFLGFNTILNWNDLDAGRRPATTTTTQQRSLKVLGLWWVTCLNWSSVWLFIKLGLRDLPPVSFAAIRLLVAIAVFLPILLLRGVRLPRRAREWYVIAVAGLVLLGLNYALLFWGAQFIPSGMTAVLQAVTPAFGLVFGHFLLEDEPFTFRALAAIAIGIAGVVLISADQLHLAGRQALLGCAAVTLGAACVGFAYVFVKRHRDLRIKPEVLACGQMLCAVGPMLAFAAAR